MEKFKTKLTDNLFEAILSLKDKLPALKTFICFENDVKPETADLAKEKNVEIIYFSEILKIGQKWRIENKGKVEELMEEVKIIVATSSAFPSSINSSTLPLFSIRHF